MSSSRPYLIRALNEWIVDNDLTPYLLVDAEQEGVQVPRQFIQDGKIVLNISPVAVRDLQLSNEGVHFNARFGGVAMEVMVPSRAVLAIYARENGQGMVFAEEGEETPPPTTPEPQDGEGKAKRPKLKLVK